MTARKTFKWSIILLVGAAAAGGGYGLFLWNESNERIRVAILEKLHEIAPEWDVTLGRARFDWNRQIHLYDFTVKAKGQSQNIVRLPETIVSIDSERFSEKQEIVIQKISLMGPILELVRDSQGAWNWQKLPPPAKSNQSCPEWEIVQATVRVRLEQTDGSPAALFMLKNADAKLIPSGKRQYLVTGLTQVTEAGKLKIDGRFDLDKNSWWFNGRMNGVTSSGELSGLAIGSSPELRQKLSRLHSAIRHYADSVREDAGQPGRSPFALASSQTTSAEAFSPGQTNLHAGSSKDVPDLGASGTLDIQFSLARGQSDTEPQFKILVNVRQGQITNDVLPFPLHDLAGTVYWDNRQFIVRKMAGKNGVTRVGLDGKVVRQAETSPGRFDVTITNLMLDKRLRSRLPPGFRRIYDSVTPSGLVDLKGTLIFDGQSHWQPHDFVLKFHDCTGAHVAFPYTIHDISGTLTQAGEQLDVDLKGRAGLRPTRMTGWIRNPGPEAEAHFDLHVEQLPLDETLVAACKPAVQKTLESLNLKGEADVDLVLNRAAGANQKFETILSAHFPDASMEFVHFRYPLKSLTGDVGYSSVDRVWRFKNLKAEHGTARLTGQGSFTNQTAPGVLDLTITARDARFDKSLELALPDNLQELWDELSPSGRLDLVSKIDWVPGRPVTITLPDVRVSDGGMTMTSFPYPLDDVKAVLSYANNRVEITSLTGAHDRTQVRANGFVMWTPGGDWRLRLVELYVDDLTPDRLFRRALPTDLRTVVEELDPEGEISLSGMLEFRGTNRPDDPLTAAWDVETIHSGGKLTTGVELEQVYGSLTARGTWDGREVDMTGRIDLDSAVVWDYQFTQVQGPYSIKGDQVLIGSREILIPDAVRSSRRRIPPEERVTFRAIGGVITLDAAAVLQEESPYHVKLTLSQGRLEQYARRYMTGAKNLQGVMDAWVELYGRGSDEDRITGRGQLRISPAALYELPILVQIASVIRPPNNTAFRYALVDFNIGGSQFHFNSIDLVGDAFSLRGHGTAGFDGKLNLDFYSMLPRSRLGIPFISAVVGEATKGWVGVTVRGQVDDPVPKAILAPQLDDALKRFLGAFGTPPPGGLPALIIPPLAPPPRNPPSVQPTTPRTTRRGRNANR